MANGIPTDPPNSRTIDFGALVRKSLGDEFHKHEKVYQFSGRRTFESSDYGTQGLYAPVATIVRSGTAQGGGASFITLGTNANGGANDYVGKDISAVIVATTTNTSHIVDFNETSLVARVVPPWTPQYLSLPGSNSNYVGTPDSPGVSITGDIDIRCKCALDDWTSGVQTFVSKYDAAVSQRSYLFQITNTGLLRLTISVTGTSTVIVTDSTAAVSFTNGVAQWVRVTLDVDDGGGNHVKNFYVSDDGESWTQLGSTVTTAGETSIFDGSAALQLGAFNAAGNGNVATGDFYYAEVRNGIGGTVVAVFDPINDAEPGDTSFVSGETGETWTITQDGATPAVLVRTSPGPTTTYTISA